MIALLLLAQIDPLPPPPPPEPGKFQPAPTAQPAPQPAPQQHPAPRAAPPAYGGGGGTGTRAAPEPYEKPERPTPTPLSHRGFQLGIRTGVALPAGRLSEQTAMAELASVQLPLFLDIGAKVTRNLFIGGYASFGLGSVSERWKRVCTENDSCASRSIHIGAELQYHFAPAELANPWLGIGFGYEWLWTIGAPETTFRGPEYARFMAGLDFRLSHDFGLGPFVDATLASYRSRDTNGKSSDVNDPAVHSWVTVGLRFVLFP